MNLDELQSVRDRERQTDKLQQLRESFYADAGELIQQLRTERDRAADRADNPYDAPEVQQLTDEINTAEQTIENIYEKRVGKIVKAASFAAADLPAEVDGMTAEEQDLFDTLVSDIKGNREHVMAVLAGEDSPAPSTTDSVPTETDAEGHVESNETAPTETGKQPSAGQPSKPAETSTETTDTGEADVSAADVMGNDGSPEPPVPELGSDEQTEELPPERQSESDESPPIRNDGGTPTGAASEGPATERSGSESGTATTEQSEPPQRQTSEDRSEEAASGSGNGVDRETVRITDDVQTFVGFDDREYDLSANDVVQLPATNVTPLLEQGVAEQLR